jgi:alpha-N-arabinofuranosidase
VKVSLGAASAKASAKSIVLAAGDLNAENSLDQPKKIAPVESTISVSGSEAQLSLPAYSMTVLRIPVR